MILDATAQSAATPCCHAVADATFRYTADSSSQDMQRQYRGLQPQRAKREHEAPSNM